MLLPDVWMKIPRGFIRREGGEKEEKVSKGYGNNNFLFPCIKACLDPNNSSPALLSLPDVVPLPSLSLY